MARERSPLVNSIWLKCHIGFFVANHTVLRKCYVLSPGRRFCTSAEESSSSPFPPLEMFAPVSTYMCKIILTFSFAEIVKSRLCGYLDYSEIKKNNCIESQESEKLRHSVKSLSRTMLERPHHSIANYTLGNTIFTNDTHRSASKSASLQHSRTREYQLENTLRWGRTRARKKKRRNWWHCKR